MALDANAFDWTGVTKNIADDRRADQQQVIQNRLMNMQIQEYGDSKMARDSYNNYLMNPEGPPKNVGEFKAAQDIQAQDAAIVKEIFQVAGNVREKGVKPESLNPLLQSMGSQIKNPKLREAFSNMQLQSNWGTKTRMALDGTEKFVHPLTGKPLGAGVFDVEFDDKMQLVRADFVEAPPEPQEPKEYPMFVAAGRKAGKSDTEILAEWNQREIAQKKAGSTKVTVTNNMTEENEESKAVGKGQGERYLELVKAGDAGFKQKGMYERIGQLLEGVNTGKLTPVGTQLAAYAKSAGINIDSNLGNKQAAQALANQLALELRNPAGGAGMPGAMSDKDREFLVNSVPGLAQTPQGNAMMIQYAKAVAQRNIDISKLATQYRKEKGTLDIGFNENLANWAETHPLFVGGRAITKSQVGGAKHKIDMSKPVHNGRVQGYRQPDGSILDENGKRLK